jgi:hypothetical protein
MDDTKIELPAWLPWATTACLAALAACLIELWMIERTRTQLLRDENLLAEASLKGAQNQLEAERIVSRREIEELRAAPGPNSAPSVTLLLVPGTDPGDPVAQGRPWGAASWDAAGNRGTVRFLGLPAPGADRDYQLWIEGSGPGYPHSCGIIRPSSGFDGSYLNVSVSSPAPPGSRFLLVETAKGGAPTLDEARAKGSIILASLPEPGKISN